MYYNVIECGVNVYGEYTMGSFTTYDEAKAYIESLIEEDKICGCYGEYEYYIGGPYNQ